LKDNEIVFRDGTTMNLKIKNMKELSKLIVNFFGRRISQEIIYICIERC